MKIVFYAGNCHPFHANSLADTELPANEIAAIKLAEKFKELGNEVTVYTSFKDPPFSIPAYIWHERLLESQNVDIFISVKYWKSVEYGLTAKKNYYLMLDQPNDYSNYGIGDKRVAAKFDRLIVINSKDSKILSKVSGFPAEKIKVLNKSKNPKNISELSWDRAAKDILAL